MRDGVREECAGWFIRMAEEGTINDHAKAFCAEGPDEVTELFHSLQDVGLPRIGFIARRLPELLREPRACRRLVTLIKDEDDEALTENYLYFLRLLLEQSSIRNHLNADYFPLEWLECILLRYHFEFTLGERPNGEKSDVGGVLADWNFLADTKKIQLLRFSSLVSRDTLLCLQLLCLLSVRGLDDFLAEGDEPLEKLGSILERAPLELVRELLFLNPDFTGFILMLKESGAWSLPIWERLEHDMEYGRRIAGGIQKARRSAPPPDGRVDVVRLSFFRELIAMAGRPLHSLEMLRKAGCLADNTEYLYLEYLLQRSGL